MRFATFNFDFRDEFYDRRQWYGLPRYVEEEEIPEMGARRGRARKGGPEGSREAHAGVEESGKGTYSHLILHVHARANDVKKLCRKIKLS